MAAKEEQQETIQEPPHTLGRTLMRLGPGMIIAGSIVGSGELIATTKTGAEAGFFLLWLILVGCAIKVFAQVEIGRYTVTYGQTALDALNHVPGPRWRVNWIVWFWSIVTLLVITQQGGIVGGVGQALAIRWPLTEAGEQYNASQEAWITQQVELGKLSRQYPKLRESGITVTHVLEAQEQAPDDPEAKQMLQNLRAERVELIGSAANSQFLEYEREIHRIKQEIAAEGEPRDAYLWATLIAVFTALVLAFGRYGLIQAVATVLVGLFTVMTIVTVVMLQLKPNWAVTGSEIAEGMTFRLPPTRTFSQDNPLFTALAAFGIIGVGATELVMYPYWCLEKGYAKYTGPRDDSPGWIHRARGWMRVMRFDAWLSMVVYTFATVAFYLLGAAVLWRSGLNPEKNDMVRTLAEMYVPVFGEYAPAMFLFGAIAVLYSTFFVAAAGYARMVSDAVGLYGLRERTPESHQRWTRIMSVVWPLLAAAVFWTVGWFLKGQAPDQMVLAAGIGGALLLPVVGVGALWFRFRRCADALKPGTLWDALLIISFVGFVIAGVWSAYATIEKYL